MGFGWGGWWNPWWWGGPAYGWGAPYPYYSDWPPYNTYPSGDYPAPYGPSNGAPNNNNNNGDSSLYSPSSDNGYNGSDVNTNLASGTPVTDPITANVAEFAPSILVYMKDGTMLVANDYWLQDGQFHYTVKYGGENTVGMDQVDLQRSVDENAKRGVKFSLKPKPAMNPNGTAANQNRGSGATPATTAPSTSAPTAHPAARMLPVAA